MVKKSKDEVLYDTLKKLKKLGLIGDNEKITVRRRKRKKRNKLGKKAINENNNRPMCPNCKKNQIKIIKVNICDTELNGSIWYKCRSSHK